MSSWNQSRWDDKSQLSQQQIQQGGQLLSSVQLLPQLQQLQQSHQQQQLQQLLQLQQLPQQRMIYSNQYSEYPITHIYHDDPLSLGPQAGSLVQPQIKLESQDRYIWQHQQQQQPQHQIQQSSSYLQIYPVQQHVGNFMYPQTDLKSGETDGFLMSSSSIQKVGSIPSPSGSVSSGSGSKRGKSIVNKSSDILAPGGVTRRAKGDKRSRMGCLTCRQRKKRCCETRPECTECHRLGLNCVWPKPGTEHKNKQKDAKLEENTINHEIYGKIKVLRGIVDYKSK